MDTITHGIAGALIGKAVFHGDDMFSRRAINRQRIMTWATMLGAIFPDSDTFRDMLSHNELLMITWHRSITHSLVCLPFFALLLATLTRALVRWRKWDAPSFAALTGIYAVGILSHIVLDLVTSFGTMVWSPVNYSRPAWDLIFILDVTFTGILLLPQILAWVHERTDKMRSRAVVCVAIAILALFAIQKFAGFVGAPISTPAILLFAAILATVFIIPLRSKSQTARSSAREDLELNNSNSEAAAASDRDSEQIKTHRRWNQAGLLCGCAYIGLAMQAHHVALVRIKHFAALQQLEVQSIGALPFPPSLWRWDGLVRTPRGIYEVRMDLAQKSAFESDSFANPAERPPVEYRFYPEAHSNIYIEIAKELPTVQKVLWFDRFPVTRFHEEAGDSIVEFSDMRFPQIRKDRPASFTYRVRMAPTGNVVEEGWAK